MITEDYVSFENAQLLKEKGFNEECFALYNPDGMLIQSGIRLNNIQVGIVKGSYSAPTLQMAMKWLREMHDLNINNELSIHGYFCSISHIVRDSLGHIIDVEDSESWETAYYDTPEEALNDAIKYCLEHLI